MDDAGRYLWGAFVLVLLTLLAMLFSASETAITSCGESRFRKLAEEGDKKAKFLCTLRERPSSFAVYASLSSALCAAAACCIGVSLYSPLIEQLLLDWFGAAEWITTVALAAAFLLCSFIVFTLGQAIPKRLGFYHAEEVAFFVVAPLRLLRYLFRPLTWPIRALSRLITHLFGYDPTMEKEDITEDEIRLMVDAGNESGSIELSEREMINNVFEFDDRSVAEIMTHRTDISAVEKEAKIADVVKIAVEEGFSRIPVYEEDVDNIVGILYAKDLLELVGRADAAEKALVDYMRPVIYVPESTRCRMLFRKLKESKIHMAVIVDEYGGTAGIATMEDLLETIVGNIQDEYDQEIEEIQKLDDDFYSFDGGVLIEEVEEIFGVDLAEAEDAETLGGLIVNTLGRIPNDGEILSVVIQGIECTVMVVEERRIVRVRARRLPEPELAEKQD